MKKYLLVYVLFPNMKKEARYISYMADALLTYCEKIVYVENAKENDWEELVSRVWEQESTDTEQGLICVTGRLFGPFWDLGNELSEFEMRKEKAMAYYDPETDIPDFFILKKGACFDGAIWQRNQERYLVCNRTGTYAVREDWFRPYTLICRGFPFLHMTCFSAPDPLRYTIGEEASRTLDWLCKDRVYDVDMIWETILETYNLYDIKQALHLNWIVQERPKKVVQDKKTIGLFFHVFYKDSLEEIMSYIKEIPSGIAVYLSTCSSQIAEFSRRLEEEKISVTAILKAGDRGRDAGALLVAFRPYLMQYEYICFLHDKKTSGGLEPESVGKSFRNLMWDSLLKNGNHICEIIEIFEKNKRLGILSPPIPVVGAYIKTILGTEWTICFDETEQLAQKLGCRIHADPKKPVFALSTSFWCRTRALAPLFTYPWNYEDFPEEPLPLDGTLNHAVERILIYIAQEQGYYSGTVTTAEYASCYMENMLCLMDDVFKELHQAWPILSMPLRVSAMVDELCRLIIFCKEHRPIFVYGAGAQAEILINRLDRLGIKICCAVVTKKGDKDQIWNYPIKEFGAIRDKLNEHSGMILAMSRKFQEEVIHEVEKAGIDYFRIGAEE